MLRRYVRRRPMTRAEKADRFGSLAVLAVGLILVWFSRTPAYHALGVLVISAVLAVQLWLPLASVIAGWPLPREVAARRFPVRRPLVAGLIMISLCLGTAVAPQTAWLVRTNLLPFPLRIVSLGLVILCAMPFWTLLVGWRRLRAARIEAAAAVQGVRS